MAVGAICHGKYWPSRGMDGVVRLLPGRQVALGISAIRGRNRQVVIVVDVAGSAGDIGVPVRQWKPGGVMIEFRAQPAVKGMARIARRRELRAYVVGIRGLLIIRQVA